MHAFFLKLLVSKYDETTTTIPLQDVYNKEP